MSRPPRWTLVLLGAAACSGDAALGPSAPPPQSPPAIEASVAAYQAVRTWTLILQDPAGRTRIAQTDPNAPTGVAEGGGRIWGAVLWSRLDSAPAARDLTLRTWVLTRYDHAGAAGGVVVDLRWVLEDQGAVLASGEAGGPLRASPRHGVLRARGRATGLGRELLAFDAISDTPIPAEPVDSGPPAGRAVVRTPGVVSLRIDDCMAADAAAFRIMHALRLVAEMGIPSRRVDRRGYCTQSLLEAMVADGNTVESHSRWHGSAPPSFGDFYLETVGAALDLRRRGFDPHVFIQPGTWRRGPTLFDGAAKLRTPYFELLRRVYVSTEAYAWPAAMRLPLGGGDAKGRATGRSRCSRRSHWQRSCARRRPTAAGSPSCGTRGICRCRHSKRGCG